VEWLKSQSKVLKTSCSTAAEKQTWIGNCR